MRGQAAIVGIAEAVSPTGVLDLHGRELEAAMIRGALDDAGLTLDDVDGVSYPGGVSGMGAVQMAEYLGIEAQFLDSTMTGGSAFEVHAQHAAMAIATGTCDVVVSVYASTPRGDRRTGRGPGFGGRATPKGLRPDPVVEWEMPYGMQTPVGAYALAASRHMYEYGTTAEQLAQIAVSAREWALLNPVAYGSEPLTIDEVLESAYVASPLHRLDCCLVTDGAGAFVMTSADRARDLARTPVLVLGAATATDHSMISQMPDLTTTAGAVSGPRSFEMAGIDHSDVDLVMGYDSFTITQLLHLEDLGFCEKGEGGAFVEDGKLGPGGSFPTNTNGGGLSYTHPGMYGMFLIVEAVRQLRGEAGERQLDSCDVAVCHGSGGMLSTMSTVVLGADSTA